MQDADVTRQKIAQMSEAQQDSIRKEAAGFLQEFKTKTVLSESPIIWKSVIMALYGR